MNPQNKWLKRAGLVLHVLIAGLMIYASSGKLFGTLPPEVVQMLTKHGLKDQIQLIGFGEMSCAVLLLLPWTSPMGVLLTSGFWGGAICLHMSHGEPYGFQSLLLLVNWVGGFLRGSVPLLALKPRTSSSPASSN